MTFQLIALIVSNLMISVLLLLGLHPILSVIAGCSLMIWTNGLPYAATFTSGLEMWGGALMPTIFVTLLGGSLGVLYTKTGAITTMANVLMLPAKNAKSESKKLILCIVGFIVFRLLLGLAGFANEAIIVTMMAMCGVIFRTANVSRKHLPALTAFAASSGTVLPGAPTMINTFLSLNFQEYSPTAYIVKRIIFWIIFCVLFIVLMTWWIGRDRKKGEGFEPGRMVLPEFEEGTELPNIVLCLIPIIVIMIVYNFLHLDSWISIMIGLICAVIVLWKYIPRNDGDAKNKVESALNILGDGVMLIPIQLMLMVLPVMIMSQAPAFQWGVNLLNDTGLNPNIALGILVLIFMFFGGLGTVPAMCPVFASVYAPMGVSLYTFALFVTWGVAFSGGLPTNASISVESNLADCKVKQTYPSIFFGSICTAAVLYILVFITSMTGFWG